MQVKVMVKFGKAVIRKVTFLYDVTMGEWPYFLIGRYTVKLSEGDLHKLFYGERVERTVKSGSLKGAVVRVSALV